MQRMQRHHAKGSSDPAQLAPVVECLSQRIDGGDGDIEFLESTHPLGKSGLRKTGCQSLSEFRPVLKLFLPTYELRIAERFSQAPGELPLASGNAQQASVIRPVTIVEQCR